MDKASTTTSESNRIIDYASIVGGYGPRSSSTYNVFRGLNTMAGLPYMPSNTDNQGVVFFTKPLMNLGYENVLASRRLAALANQSEDSAANAFRCLLSPKYKNYNVNDKSRSKLVDDRNPFITLLSNTCITLSPPPDYVPDVYVSNEGMAKQAVSWIDDRPTEWRPWSMSASFQNMDGDPITTLFTIMTEYSARIADGTMSPFAINIINDRIDYQMGVYRFVLDQTRRFVQSTFRTIAFPRVSPNGVKFGLNRERAGTDERDLISVEFQCIGAEKDDPITVYEFNKLVTTYNGDMDPSVRRHFYTQLKNDAQKQLFAFRDPYPYIEDNYELTWWVRNEIYELVMEIIKESEASNNG